jgi:hypothetical protein
MLSKIISVIALTAILSAFQLKAQERPAYDFLKVDPSARASALAGAFETYTEDPNVIFYNPAGLSTSDKKLISAGFGKYLLDINFGSAAFQMKYKNAGWFGVGIKYFNYGTFDLADEEGNTSGTFNASDLMFSLGYSNFMYDKINFGINVKFIYSSIAEYKSTAAAMDFGFLYIIPEERINLALSVNNLGLQINSYAESKERLPLDVRIGLSKQLEHLPLKISFSLNNINESKEKFIQHFKSFSIGGEIAFSDNVSARIGYNNERRQDLKLGTSLGIAGFSAGIGIKVADKYKFDYSLNSFGKVGSMHRFNLGYSFDK